MILGLVLSLLLASPSPQKILIVGDSLTAGYGLREDQAYPAVLEKKFLAAGYEVKVLNGGVSGDTTAGGLRRLSWMLKKSSPDLVVLALGGNDMLRGLPPAQTKENLKKMIAIAEKERIPVAVLGIRAPANLGPQYVRNFDNVFENLSKEGKIPVLKNYIQSVAGKSDFNLSDLIHPNEKGQQKLAEEVFQFLRPLVQKIRVSERK